MTQTQRIRWTAKEETTLAEELWSDILRDPVNPDGIIARLKRVQKRCLPANRQRAFSSVSHVRHILDQTAALARTIGQEIGELRELRKKIVVLDGAKKIHQFSNRELVDEVMSRLKVPVEPLMEIRVVQEMPVKTIEIANTPPLGKTRLFRCAVMGALPGQINPIQKMVGDDVDVIGVESTRKTVPSADWYIFWLNFQSHANQSKLLAQRKNVSNLKGGIKKIANEIRLRANEYYARKCK